MLERSTGAGRNLFRMFLILAAALLTSSAGRAAAVNDLRLAVLPLTNSGDPGADYFADAMTEEIGAALTGIPNLHVVARVSAFQSKGKAADPIAAGHELGATHLIEGSASKMGDRILLSLHLVSASDGGELWHADYDRAFADSFDVEDAIARAVLQTLHAEPRTRAVSHRTANMDAYDKYLRAQPLIRARGRQAFAGAAKLLEDVVAAGPDFEPALSLLAFDYDIAPLYDPSLRAADTEAARKFVQSVVPRAEMLARRAAELDPHDANAYLALAYAASIRAIRSRPRTIFGRRSSSIATTRTRCTDIRSSSPPSAASKNRSRCV